MSYLTWGENYRVNIKEMDEQHQKLFALISDYYDAIAQKKTKEANAAILQGLLDYTRYHFGDEEKLMLQNNFPGYQEQKAQHDIFLATIQDYQKRLNEGRLLLSVEITGFVKDWLIQHILGKDKEYGPFLNAKGIR